MKRPTVQPIVQGDTSDKRGSLLVEHGQRISRDGEPNLN